jgi:transposase, IS30 family
MPMYGLSQTRLEVKIPHRVSIRHRPAEIGERAEFGHWEGDTIVGDGHKTGIHTEVERVSRFVFAYKVPKIRAKETSDVQLLLFGWLPRQARQSTTLDNGSEHYLHTRLQEELGMRTYFADPYCAWQRGTSESTNGLLRRYFPKRTDFRQVSQARVDEVVARLNTGCRRQPRAAPPSTAAAAVCSRSSRPSCSWSGSRLSATIQALSSSVQRRRRPMPVITSSRQHPSPFAPVVRLC